MEKVEDKRLEAATKRAKEKIEFIQHLMVYIVVNFFLVVLNFLISPGSWWSLWAIAGWGIGLACHFLSVFIFNGMLAGLEQKLIESELKK